MLTRARASSGAPILWILVLALVLAGVLAYQALDAARSHRRASEEALRDYASFATWELGRSLVGAVTSSLSASVLHGRMVMELGESGPSLPAFARAVEEGLGPCGCPEAVHDFFALDLSSGSVSLSRERLTDAQGAWLEKGLLPRVRESVAGIRLSREVRADRAVEVVERRQVIAEKRLRTGAPADSLVERKLILAPTTPFTVTSLPESGQSVLVYTLAPGPDGGMTRALGFVLDVPGFVVPLLRDVVAGTPLLPPSLLDRASNEQVLSLDVRTAAGEPLYRSGDSPGEAGVVVDTVPVGVGELVIRAAIRPGMADRLVIGGLPRSRLPLLLVVFALTLGLLVIAARQFARQQELIRLRSDFVSGVSHELRTPLAQIRLFSDLLDSGRLHDVQRQRSVRIIGEEARRLTFLVENILQFSRAERRITRVAPEPAEVAPLVREIVEAFAPLARARRVELQVQAEAEAEAVAAVDADAFRQVLLNLLDNAVKYGPPGQRVTVGVEAAGDRVRVRVDDQGPGIPQDERERIWEPYRRLPRDVESATGGSGIGLAVVRELVELHGGGASAADAPGGGARFLIELPRVRLQEEGAPGAERPTSRTGGANG